MNPLRVTLVAVGALVAVVLLVATGTAYTSANDWAAVVDGHEVPERDFLEELAEFRDNEGLAQSFSGLGQAGQGAVPADLASVWLTRLIQQELIDQIAEDRGIRATEVHRQQAEQINIRQFQSEQVWASFPPWFRDRMLDRDARFIAVVEAVGGSPTEAELAEAYEAGQEELLQACASHILVETKEQADALKAQLDAGADFAALAQAHSIDEGSVAQGGDLGCQSRGSYPEPFDSQVFTLPLDTVSDPVETQFGFHIIKVASREVTPFEEVRQELAQRVQAEAQERFARLLFELIEKADIEVNPKYGKFEISVQGPRVATPLPPRPPDRLPVGGDGEGQEGESPFIQVPPQQ